jgi:hypothetical protein
VQLWDCNSSAAQGWRLVGRTLRVYTNPDRCLDVTNGNLTRGTPVQIWECTANNGAQVWSVRADGTIRTSNNLCLDAQSGATGNGTRLQIWDCNGTLAQQWAGPALDNGGTSVQNLKSGRCMEAAGGLSALGTAVQLWDCNGTAAQRWVRDGQTLRVFGNECLDVKEAKLQSGQPVQVWACTANNGAQVWSVRADGTIRTSNNLCLDAQSGATGNGTRLQIWDCNGTPAQQWAGPALDNGGTSVQNLKSGRCMEAAGGLSALGTAVQLWDCNGTAAQRWVRDGQTLRVFGNECLDVKEAKLQSGQPVQVWACTANNGAQVWSVRADGTIRTSNNLCLDAQSGATGNGTRLQIWDCNGTPAQAWTGVKADPGPPADPPAPATPTAPAAPGNPAGGGSAIQAPSAVTGVRVRFPAKHVAVLSWPATANTTSYTARKSKKNSSKKWGSWYKYTSPSVRLTKLKKGATYRLQIAPHGPGGYGATTTWRFKQRK